LLAKHPNSLERALNRRFDRNDPPPYESSSESDSFNGEDPEEPVHHPVLARTEEAVMEEFRDSDRLREPLSDVEIVNILRSLNHTVPCGAFYTPGKRFRDETRRERELLNGFERSEKVNKHTYDFLTGPRGHQRCAVIARHNVKKRWERLGIWNPEWDTLDRPDGKPNANRRTWKWKWQSDADPPPYDPQHFVSRAIELRKGLGYGEHVPPPPHSHLRDDVSASEAESFLISRPWFMLEVERVEFARGSFVSP
jgi:hypothetical protein